MVVNLGSSKDPTSSSKTGLLLTQKCFSSKGYPIPKILKRAAQEQTKKWLSQNLTTGVSSTQTAAEIHPLKSIETAPQATFTQQSVPLKTEYAWEANKSLDSPLRRFLIVIRQATHAKEDTLIECFHGVSEEVLFRRPATLNRQIQNKFVNLKALQTTNADKHLTYTK